MVDVDAGVLLQGLLGAGDPQVDVVAVQVPERERFVDLERGRRGHLAVAHLAGRDVHPRVPRDRHHVRPFPVRRDVQDHQRVRLGGGEALAEAAALADPGVRADDHDVLGLRVQVHRLVAQFAGDVHLVQVAVQVPVDRVGAAEGDQQHDGDAAGRPGQDLLRPAGVRPAATWSGGDPRRPVPGAPAPGRRPRPRPGVSRRPQVAPRRQRACPRRRAAAATLPRCWQPPVAVPGAGISPGAPLAGVASPAGVLPAGGFGPSSGPGSSMSAGPIRLTPYPHPAGGSCDVHSPRRPSRSVTSRNANHLTRRNVLTRQIVSPALYLPTSGQIVLLGKITLCNFTRAAAATGPASYPPGLPGGTGAAGAGRSQSRSPAAAAPPAVAAQSAMPCPRELGLGHYAAPSPAHQPPPRRCRPAVNPAVISTLPRPEPGIGPCRRAAVQSWSARSDSTRPRSRTGRMTIQKQPPQRRAWSARLCLRLRMPTLPPSG